MSRPDAVDKYILAREVALLFQCVRCKDNPLSPPVHICPVGHPTCHSCYSVCNIECSVCHRPVVGRNECLELVVQNMAPITALTLSHLSVSDTPPDDDMEQYDPRLLAKLELAHYQSIRNSRLANVDTDPSSTPGLSSSSPGPSFSPPGPSSSPPSVSDVQPIIRLPPISSHTPLKCPTCGKLNTPSAFVSHYEYDHQAVLMVATDYNVSTCKVIVKPSAFSDCKVQCLAVFLVPNEIHATPSSARILSGSNDPIDLQLRHGRESMVCLVLASNFILVHEDPKSDGDAAETFFVAWTACLYPQSPITYTIEAVNNADQYHSFKYCGPMTTLHQPQRAGDVFRSGNGLAVTPGLLKKLVDPVGNIDIAVTFHPVFF